MIDLDNLQIIPDGDEPSPSINPASTSSLEEVYDRHMKLIYCVDISGSMSSYLFDLETVEDFHWTGARFTVRNRIENAIHRLNELVRLEESMASYDEDADLSPVPPPHYLAHEDAGTDHIWASMAELDWELQKVQIVQHSLFNEIELVPNSRKAVFTEQNTKINVVKGELKKLIEERFKKYPGADVHLVRFGEYVHYKAAKTEADLLEQVDGLTAREDETHIGDALAKCISLCRRRPSEVDAHHVVLISDGLDSSLTRSLPHLTAQMKEMNIVLDFIHVGSPHEACSWEYSADALRESCKTLNGDYRIVSRLKDFRSRIQEAGRRLCLPAPSNS